MVKEWSMGHQGSALMLAPNRRQLLRLSSSGRQNSCRGEVANPAVQGTLRDEAALRP